MEVSYQTKHIPATIVPGMLEMIEILRRGVMHGLKLDSMWRIKRGNSNCYTK